MVGAGTELEWSMKISAYALVRFNQGQLNVGEGVFRCSDRLKGPRAQLVFSRLEHKENENQLVECLHAKVSLIKPSAV